MARCTLSNTPDALCQAVLHCLTSQDIASVRQVSRAVCSHTTCNVSCINLRLSASSTTEQLQQWLQITRRFQHVSRIHLRITGKVAADVFERAMQLLSQRKMLLELHLLPYDGGGSRTNSSKGSISVPCMPSLQPLQHILPQLRTLVIEGISVKDLAADLHKLASAAPVGGWQLQNLTLNVYWDYPKRFRNRIRPLPCLWQKCASATKQLVSAFPELQQLGIQMPPVGYRSDVAAVDDQDFFEESSLDLDDGVKVLDALSHLAQCDSCLAISEKNSKVQAATAKVAAVAAMFNAALQLKRLTVLALTAVPDIWVPINHPLVDRSIPQQSHSRWETSAVRIAARVAAARAEARAEEAAAPSDSISKRSSLCLTSAATALDTLDDSGSWLLQHHCTLQEVHMTTACFWSMCWQRQQQQQHPQSSSSLADGTAAPVLLAATVNWNQSGAWFTRLRSTGTANAGSSSDNRFQSLLIHHLSHYSSRPASVLMHYINECQLVLDHYDVNSLADLLGGFKSLKHLQVIINCKSTSNKTQLRVTDSEATAAAVRAAGTVSGLQSLQLYVIGSTPDLPDDLLLPLSTGAGGPGSNLQKLWLSTNFSDATDSTVVAGSRCATSSFGWLYGFRALGALRELNISQWNTGARFRFPVDSLPDNLQVFSGKRLVITAAESDADDSGVDSWDRGQVILSNATTPLPQLQQLFLEDCRVASPSILASQQLQQLTVIDSNWSGGWVAATAAWPNVRKLVWNRDKDYICSNGAKSGSSSDSRQGCVMAEADKVSGYIDGNSHNDIGTTGDIITAMLLADHSTADRVLQDLSTGFRHLTSLTLQDLPWLNIKVLTKPSLRHVVQHIKGIQHVHLNIDTSEYCDPECWGLDTVGKVYRHWACMQVVRSRLSGNDSIIDLDAKPRALQGWLQEQLPWATVIITTIDRQ